jgi:hypothetical protein
MKIAVLLTTPLLLAGGYVVCTFSEMYLGSASSPMLLIVLGTISLVSIRINKKIAESEADQLPPSQKPASMISSQIKPHVLS